MKHKESACKVEKKRKERYKEEMFRFYHDVIFQSESRGNILSWAGIHQARFHNFINIHSTLNVDNLNVGVVCLCFLNLHLLQNVGGLSKKSIKTLM